jgi:hypothetical protein
MFKSFKVARLSEGSIVLSVVRWMLSEARTLMDSDKPNAHNDQATMCQMAQLSTK